MKYRIAPITKKHIRGFNKAVDAVARERKFLAFLEGPSLKSSRVFVLDNIKRKFPQFVVLDGNKVVGWCDVIPNESRPVYIHSGVLGVGLVAGYRGKGIGRKLMQTAIDAAFAYGLTRIALTVRAKNVNAIALYKKLGFKMEGRHKNAVRIGRRYEDLYTMALLKK